MPGFSARTRGKNEAAGPLDCGPAPKKNGRGVRIRTWSTVLESASLRRIRGRSSAISNASPHTARMRSRSASQLNRDDYAPQFEKLDASGLVASSVQTTVHSLFPDSLAPAPHDPQDRLQHIMSSIERIAPLVPPATPFVVITGAAPQGNCRLAYDYAVGALEQLAAFAAQHGVRIAFEPLNPVLLNTDTALWGLDDALDLVGRVAHPSLGLCLDTWNVFKHPPSSASSRAAERASFSCKSAIGGARIAAPIAAH